MNELIQFITQGAETFTPQSLVGLIVFAILFEGICSLIGAMIGGLHK